MSWLLVAAVAVMVVPLGLFALWAAGGTLPGWLSPWAITALLGASVAGFLAAAIADLAGFGLYEHDR